MLKYLVVGLGNIGVEYAGTRHNIGFDVADALARRHEGVFKPGRLADICELKFRGKKLIIIKPATYMNVSGKAVKYWVDKEAVPLQQMLVIVDECAIPIDRIRLRPSGSDGGHNGLKSIQEALQTQQYPRLRFGIGNEFPKGGQVDYVLGPWLPEQLPLVKLKVQKCVEVIESFVIMGIERTMNEANKLVFSV